MTEVFGWLGDAARGLLSIFPQRRIVKAGYGAVRHNPNGSFRVLGPGWFIFWPLFQELESFPIARQTSDIPKQPLVTKDGIAVSAGGVIRYSVKDVELFCVKNVNAFDDIDDVAQISIRDAVINNTFHRLQTARKGIDRMLTTNAGRRLASYGVEVHDVNLKGLAPAQLLHVVSDSQVPVLISPSKEADQS